MLFKRYYCIKQQEQKDCGCACLATIFKQFGLRIPIHKMRDLAKTDHMAQAYMALQWPQKTQVITDSQNFQIKLAIPNDKIGDVKLEDGVKYSFSSFPYAQYGFLNGKITPINVTSTTDEQTGLSYYQVTGSLDKGTIRNFQGQKGIIKLGMT